MKVLGFTKVSVILSLFLYFVIQIFIFTQVLLGRSPEFSSSDRVWLEKFFKDVMLDHSAIYTLFGSKPITSIPIHYFTQEEKELIYSQMTDEELENAIYIYDYDLPENWEKWEVMQFLFPSTKFLFFRVLDEDPHFAKIYFVNIKKTQEILKKYYSLFAKITEGDFDPKKVVFEMNPPSIFWKRVFASCELVGLLYGFGAKNVSYFLRNWMIDYECKEKRALHTLDQLDKASIEEFNIPVFISFSIKSDPVIEKFKRERNKIKKQLLSKDFLNSVLERFCE